MPSYQVQFSTSRGDVSEVALNAPSLPALSQRLAQNGCGLVRVVPARPDPSLRGYWRRVSEAEVVTLLRQVAVSLDNGVSIADALSLQARETRNPTLRPILLDVERAIRNGDSVSAALSRYPRLFSGVHTRLLEAGEASHRLPEVLRQLADYAERAAQANLRIRTSLVYPQVVGIFTFTLMMVTFVGVVPKFIDLFKELGVKEFPWVTASLLWASSAILPSLIFAAPIIGLALWTLYYRAERNSAFQLAHLKMRIPILGALYYQFALLRLTRLLSALLSGGVPLLEALRLAGQGADSALLQAAMWDAIPRVAAGETLAGAFSHSGILPPTFVGQIASAEASGNLPDALNRLAIWYSDRVDYLAARVGALLEPFFILFLAGMAGWIALGVFMPLVSILQSLSGGGN
jgi:type IV pilus assembly protein PilC